MLYTASNLLKIARAEIGYLEKATVAQLDDKTANAGSNNITKYWVDLHAAGYYQANKQGVSWCDGWVDWLILKLLYHPDIKCGMNAQQCEEIIRKLYY